LDIIGWSRLGLGAASVPAQYVVTRNKMAPAGAFARNSGLVQIEQDLGLTQK